MAANYPFHSKPRKWIHDNWHYCLLFRESALNCVTHAELSHARKKKQTKQSINLIIQHCSLLFSSLLNNPLRESEPCFCVLVHDRCKHAWSIIQSKVICLPSSCDKPKVMPWLQWQQNPGPCFSNYFNGNIIRYIIVWLPSTFHYSYATPECDWKVTVDTLHSQSEWNGSTD